MAEMKLSKFKYRLPDEQIALHPSENRDEAKLMVLDKKKVPLSTSSSKTCSTISMTMTY